MILSYLWCGCAIISAFCSILFQIGGEVGTSLIQGAVSAINISISMAGPICLWAGLGNLMSKTGISNYLSIPLKSVLWKLFPSARDNQDLANALSSNVCANLLGLGNAATPMGIQAVRHLKNPDKPNLATDEMCRLVILNTASIQLLPTTVAAIRAASGCNTPLDILPCVWISSLLSVSAGLMASGLFRKLWRDE